MKLVGFGALAVLISVISLAADAAEVKVLSLPGIRAAFDQLIPQFERDKGHKVTEGNWIGRF
jgi:ABC-type molybdate transport system substrate-binding protein